MKLRSRLYTDGCADRTDPIPHKKEWPVLYLGIYRAYARLYQKYYKEEYII